MLKKLFLIFAIVFLLCGCKKEEPKNVITFSSWGSVTEVSVLKKIISDFENENPHIKIKFMHIPQNYFQKIHLLFASNTAPDVIFINNLNLPIYEKYLEDLSNFIDKKEYFSVAIDSLSYEDKILAIPRDISNLVFYVNLSKINLPDKNWKLEEILNKRTKSDFVISYEDDIYWALPYLSYFDDVDLTNGFSTEEIKGINFYNSMRDKYKIAPTKSQIGSSTLAQMFLDEKIIFYLSGRWMYPKIKEKASFSWAVINFPYGKGKQVLDSSGWALAKTSKNKKEAIKFIQYLSNEKSAEYFAKTGLIVPARIDAASILNNTEKNEKVFIETINHSKPTIVNKDYKKITDEINLKYFK